MIPAERKKGKTNIRQHFSSDGILEMERALQTMEKKDNNRPHPPQQWGQKSYMFIPTTGRPLEQKESPSPSRIITSYLWIRKGTEGETLHLSHGGEKRVGLFLSYEKGQRDFL